MAKFFYNNAKNAKSGHILFELNYSYHSWISYKENVNLYFKLKSANKLSAKLRELIIVWAKSLPYLKILKVGLK